MAGQHLPGFDNEYLDYYRYYMGSFDYAFGKDLGWRLGFILCLLPRITYCCMQICGQVIFQFAHQTKERGEACRRKHYVEIAE